MLEIHSREGIDDRSAWSRREDYIIILHIDDESQSTNYIQ